MGSGSAVRSCAARRALFGDRHLSPSSRCAAPSPAFRHRRSGAGAGGAAETRGGVGQAGRPDRKRVVEGKSGSVRVDLGGRRIINKKTYVPRQEITHRKRRKPHQNKTTR